ncbi:MAG TPA: CPBP family intramembrane glutamic endopeptidase, partial [Anaerolineales bacterium]|nr:CPBP family intramembrane glutamic endopeptidase [Anaerolineales bacterium]
PRIILQEAFTYPVSNQLATAIPAVVIALGLVLTFIWDTVRDLRRFFIVALVLVIAEWFVYNKVSELFFYPAWLKHPSFNVYMLAQQSLRLLVTLVIIAALFILKKHPSSFVLVKGDVDAPAAAVRPLGIKAGEPWNRIGRNFAVILSSGTLAFLILAGRPPLDIVMRALPFLPAVLLAAALNAFNEEMTYKASFLSVLENVVGKHQALWLMAVYFGIGHYYGIPYGVIGVLMAGFLGWFLGKSMLETRGLWWAWFIHFWQDVLIFAFLAIGSITPGGS